MIAIIPARYASTRFPGKPLAQIGGVSMIERVYRQARLAFDRVIIATDDARIESHAQGFSAEVIMTSPDHPSGTDRLAEVVSRLGLQGEVIVNIQGDEPFIAHSQLEQIKSLFGDPQCQIATLVKPFAADEDIFNPNAVKAIFAPDGRAIYFSRSAIPHLRGVDSRQWASRCVYYKHIGLYGYRGDVLLEVAKLAPSALEKAESLEQLRWLEHGYRIKVAITNSQSIGIDTPQDLVQAERYLLSIS